MNRRVYALAITGLLVLAGASSVAAQTYVESGVQGKGKQHVIITVTPGAEADVINAVTQSGGSVKSQHPSINSVAADIDGASVASLASHGVVAITMDHTVHLTAAGKGKKAKASSSLDPNAPQDMGVSTLRLSLGLSEGSAANLSSGINGSGVGIAIIDSGIVPSADLPHVGPFYDFTQTGKAVQSAPYDDLGHGTHIAGLIASTGVLSNYMFQGVAPNVNIVALKVLDKYGASRTSTVIAAIEFAVKNRKALGIQIINLSLGHPITAPAKFDPLVKAVESAVRSGVTVVVAAGNDGPGYGSINSPGNAPSAITVGAVDGKTTVTRTDDYVPDFSSRGPTWYDGFPKPDVSAPGVNLFSDAAAGSTLVTSTNPAYPQETVGAANLLDLSGTSMAAAVATGVVALELDANTHQATAPLTPNAAKAILEYTSIKLANADALTQGAGQVNAAGATDLAGAVNTAAVAGSWWLTGGVDGSSTIGGQSYDWSDNIIWGTSLFSGKFIYSNGLMWDDNIVWGTGLVRGQKLVAGKAGDNIIWGTGISLEQRNIVFGKADDDNIVWGTSNTLAQFRVVGERVGNKIVWNTADSDNIIWGTLDSDNIVWGTDDGDNIIWGTWSGDGDNIIWGTTADDNIIWGTSAAADNIVWGTSAAVAKVVHGKAGDNIVWGTADSDNIIWGTADSDNIIWGTSDDNIIWGTDDGDNIIWGTDGGDNIIWGTSVGGRS